MTSITIPQVSGTPGSNKILINISNNYTNNSIDSNITNNSNDRNNNNDKNYATINNNDNSNATNTTSVPTINIPKTTNKTISSTTNNNRTSNNKTSNNNSTNNKISIHNTNSNNSTFRRTDEVKSGRLFVQKSSGFFHYKSWHERALILRDTWTEACQGGISSLELYHPNNPSTNHSTNHSTNQSTIQSSNRLTSPTTNTPTNLSIKSSNPLRPTKTFNLFSCISKKTNKYDTKSKSQYGRLPKHNIDHCYIDLSTVSSVHQHPSNKPFPHAFILHRKDKDSVVFGAKSDLEAREWMMAIRHLANKAHKTLYTTPLSTPLHLTFEDGIEMMRSRDDLRTEMVHPPVRCPSNPNITTHAKKDLFANVPKPPPRPKARISTP